MQSIKNIDTHAMSVNDKTILTRDNRPPNAPRQRNSIAYRTRLEQVQFTDKQTDSSYQLLKMSSHIQDLQPF